MVERGVAEELKAYLERLSAPTGLIQASSGSRQSIMASALSQFVRSRMAHESVKKLCLATLAAAWTYPNRTMTVSVDGAPPITGKFIAVVCANGNSMAGGMHLAPEAKIEDGLLDILFMHEQTRSERLRNFPKIYSGSHLGSPKFSCSRGRSISLTSEENVALEADGELLGRLPCRIEVLPSALQVRVRPPEKG